METRKSSQTKIRIKNAARELFNELGTKSVHTHDIAKKVGISPGNLYYHYSNKEEIIREIFSDIEIFKPEAWVGEDFGQFTEFYFRSLSQYRFFFNDFYHILSNDNQLLEKWRGLERELSSAMKKMAQKWVRDRYLRPFSSPEDLEAFIELSWIVLSFSPVYVNAKRALSSKKQNEAAMGLVLKFLLPYHTGKGKSILRKHTGGI